MKTISSNEDRIELRTDFVMIFEISYFFDRIISAQPRNRIVYNILQDRRQQHGGQQINWEQHRSYES
jgi:hypothetical protein